MANYNALVSKWVGRANIYLHNFLTWTTQGCDKGFYVMSYEDKVWTIQYSDLEQLAHDLGIHTSMYPRPTNVGKTTKWDDLVQPAQPETFVVFNADNDMWFLTVMGVTFCVSGEIAGKMLNAGCEYRKYQPR